MNIIYTLIASKGQTIIIGRETESGISEVLFDITEWQAQLPDGSSALWIDKDGELYPKITTTRNIGDKNYLVWTIELADTATAGKGRCQLTWSVPSEGSDVPVRAKTIIYDFLVTESLGGESVPPANAQSWVDEVNERSSVAVNAGKLAERYAKGTENGEAIAAGTPGYHDNALYYKNQISQSVNAAATSATLAESWAIGGTNTRANEDINNSKYYSQQSASYRDAALNAKNTALNAKTAAETAKTAAENARTAAENARTDAINAKNAAAVSESNASIYKNQAQTARNQAREAKTDAETAKTDAIAAKDNANDSATIAEAAKNGAVTAKTDAITARNSAQIAETNTINAKNEANNNAILSESWAIGNTNTRTGENTNNAKYWSSVAQAAAGGGVVSFNGRGGAVESENGDYTAEMVGADPAGAANTVQSNLNTHITNGANPHNVTAAQAGADPAGSADTVQSNLNTHATDLVKHLTAQERNDWSSRTRKPKTFELNLSASNWATNKTQILTSPNFLIDGYAYFIAPQPTDTLNYSKYGVYADNITITNQIKFHCKDIPDSDISIQIFQIEANDE